MVFALAERGGDAAFGSTCSVALGSRQLEALTPYHFRHAALSALGDLAILKLGCCLCWQCLDWRMKS